MKITKQQLKQLVKEQLDEEVLQSPHVRGGSTVKGSGWCPEDHKGGKLHKPSADDARPKGWYPLMRLIDGECIAKCKHSKHTLGKDKLCRYPDRHSEAAAMSESLSKDNYMKITKKRLNQLVREEMLAINEQGPGPSAVSLRNPPSEQEARQKRWDAEARAREEQMAGEAEAWRLERTTEAPAGTEEFGAEEAEAWGEEMEVDWEAFDAQLAEFHTWLASLTGKRMTPDVIQEIKGMLDGVREQMMNLGPERVHPGAPQGT